MSSTVFWLGGPIQKCFLEYFRAIQARIIDDYNHDYDEEMITTTIINAFRDDQNLKECIQSKNLPFARLARDSSEQRFVIDISVRKEIRHWESEKTGMDLAITFDIDVPPKKVKKSVLLQAKILRELDGSIKLPNLVDKTFSNQLEKLSNYPERASYILWYGPPKITIPGQQNKDFGPRVIPVSVFDHYREDPIMYHLLADSIPLDKFLIFQGLQTEAGSTDVRVVSDANGIFILDKRSKHKDPNIRVGARGHIRLDLKAKEKVKNLNNHNREKNLPQD